ncbi:hypothetical protein NDU88_003918 [Pleurodeles waltl]|uniref:Uncharacterized protein n=1 Tax=Pleurodeles waltl TaxID=8319 RepID=A0AAV7REA6_PLEWA|nr:hypothetical protein NDU88_003918 [Pleurodeles waltl]
MLGTVEGKSVGTVVDPLPEVVGGCVDWWVPGEGGDQLFFGDLLPAAVGNPLWVVVHCGFLEDEVDAAVVGPVAFGGVAGGEDGVERVVPKESVDARACVLTSVMESLNCGQGPGGV